MPYDDRLPPLQSLHVFEVAARHLSFTAAAREMNTTQPAISQQIQGLEAHLQVPLFIRVYRGVELTEAGQKLFVATQSSLNTLRKALDEIRYQKKFPRINVATDFAFAAFWLLLRLPQFRKKYPEVDIRIQTSQSEFELAGSETDVAILFGDGEYRGCVSQMLIPEQVFPVCSPGYLKEHGPIDSLTQLSSQALLKLDAEPGHRWLDWNGLFRSLKSSTIPGEPVLEFNNYTLLVQAAMAGQGVGLGWTTLVDHLIDDGLLVALRDFTVHSNHGYFLVLPDNSESSPPVESFVKWLRENLATKAGGV
ncbi:LysR family transcriptional regulator [Hahella sp. CCB-MM4]|uniref:choline sulfate utilization transcriptional regulator n=1 Tax=Hahella sp. (strain CCB-MM4) TaxID=1926491 RepID=UPI000B9C08E6|nr:LysR substrate-binding domain-containing protein [Hahella sp. CCB-MM4]OZG74624.1 LysR family transcriptional regulator [Hahella sp. CCB-MM4]